MQDIFGELKSLDVVMHRTQENYAALLRAAEVLVE